MLSCGLFFLRNLDKNQRCLKDLFTAFGGNRRTDEKLNRLKKPSSKFLYIFEDFVGNALNVTTSCPFAYKNIHKTMWSLR
jgi:hypothetical protein